MTPSLLSRAFMIVRGLLYSAGFIWMWAWIALSLRRFDGAMPLSLPTWLRPLGFALAIPGGLLVAACIATFVTRGRGTPAPFDPPRAFVATGPYRYVRNPMYVGAAAVILGAGLIVSSPSIVLLTFGFLMAMHLLVVLYEERVLNKQFGPAYREYRATVHRWLIRTPRASAPP